MACRNNFKTNMANEKSNTDLNSVETQKAPESSYEASASEIERLLFGVNSKSHTNVLLQNNLEHFDWIVRNKIYPNFCGRYINGDDCLTKDEIKYIHEKGCKIAAIYSFDDEKNTETQGKIAAKKACVCALELGIPQETAIFLEVYEKDEIGKDFLMGFIEVLLTEGYMPGIKANTDSKFSFDREFSRCALADFELLKKCLVWAVAPTISEYDGITTSHLIHPDIWKPYAPSGMTRNDIAIWQYGKDCHPIQDDDNKTTTFNLDLVRSEQIIVERMF